MRQQLAKELRALALPFVATLLLLIGFAALGDRRWGSFALTAYFFGTASVGALSVGHEYVYRTLPILLAQPVQRGRLLLLKLAVLLPMLLVLTAVAPQLPFEPFDDEAVILWMAPLAALFLAPWLTMLCRNAVAGVAFCAGIPGGSLALCNLIAYTIYGESPQAEGLALTLYTIMGGVIAVTGAIFGVRTFLTLEAIDGPGAPLQLPRLPRAAAGAASLPSMRRRSAFWMLVNKELHLQQMSFIVAAVSVAMFTAIWLLLMKDTKEDYDVFTMVAVLYSLMLAVLIGALSSAEERHLGTIGWQMMLPYPASVQWTIKVAVALTLAVILSVGIPSVFGTAFDAASPRYILPILVITSLAIYVSSRSSSGIHALLVSCAVVPVIAVPVSFLLRAAAVQEIAAIPASVVAGLVALIALRAGLTHHRTAR